MSLIKEFEHLKIQLEAIKSATDNFADDNCIGRGGFGKVYKGELVHSKGQTTVALKRLDRAFGQGDPQFWKEIIMLSLYKHENIVSLLGFCDESGEKILVYDYVSKRSLDLYLNNNELTWVRRLKICIGAARGLAYLHNPAGTQQRVLHRDIKSANILLDENWNARISDMGLSKFGPANQQYTFLVSNAVGTFGYWDPIYAETGLLTKESDVYSFGVVLFEVLCGRLCMGNTNDQLRPLIGMVRECYQRNKITDIICDNIKTEINPYSLEAFVTIAYQCLKMNLKERPSMKKIVRRLESALEHQISIPSLDSILSKNILQTKRHLKDFSPSSSGVEKGRSNVFVNGQLLTDRDVEKAKWLAGPIHPGEYWYDYLAGFWGVMNQPCNGIIPPFIEEFDHPMPKNCAAGNTGICVNGRELNQKDLDLLADRGLPTTKDRSYIIDISGKVVDEDTGEELDGLGKLAPTVERVKHGFGMKVPKDVSK